MTSTERQTALEEHDQTTSPQGAISDPPLKADIAVEPASETALLPAAEAGCGCSSQPSSGGDSRFVYAIGDIDLRFPSMGVEKEYLQAVKEADTANLTDRQTIHRTLIAPENRYLARNVCFVFSIQGIESYILKARTEGDLEQLIEAARPGSGNKRNVVIGTLGPIAPPGYCSGLQIPIIPFDRIYTFEIDEFVKAIPRPESVKAATFQETARELFFRVMQLADNAGQDDTHRAINYLALRYPAIYSKTVEMFAADKSLTAVDVRQSRLSGTRRILDVIFAYTDRNTDVMEKFFVRVDVTERWLFLVSKLQPYFDREH